MSDVIDDPNEPENEDGNEENEEEEEEEDTLLDEWETEGDSTTFELHGFDDHEEVLVIGGPHEDESDDVEHIVALALTLKELDETIEILKEIREKMAERQKSRLPAPPAVKQVK
jgi:hypothetical protein